VGAFLVWVEYEMKKEINQVLFVCAHNRFRSKVAEYLLKKYTRQNNPDISIESAGTRPDYQPVASNVIKALKEFGVKTVNVNSRKINQKLIDGSDLIIIVANNVKKRELGDLKHKRVLRWKISDTNQENCLGILTRVKNIDKKVKNLVKNL
jgi:protein-tyrosine-phosphatase